jgi:hypothetical protein
MIDVLYTIQLPSNRGRAHLLAGGTIMIQQGRPFGVMAQPGESMLSFEDMKAIDDMIGMAMKRGWKPDPPGTIRAT